jgi:hypothetical protein
LVKEKVVKLKNPTISITPNQKHMLDKEDNQVNALEVFMSLPDELIMSIVKYDSQGLYMMCLSLGLHFIR